MTYFGIDLGASKCSVAYSANSNKANSVPQATVVQFRNRFASGNKSGSVPSLAARAAASGVDFPTLFAFDADEAVRMNRVGGRNGHQVFRSVKSHLGTGRSYVRADASLNTPVKVWAGLIRRLCEMTIDEKCKEFDPRRHPVVLTVPASFGKSQRDDTLEAARLAGFDVAKSAGLVQLIDEPVAALIDAINDSDMEIHAKPEGSNHVLVFDFGGGTCDLTLMEFRYDASKPTGIDVRSLACSPYQQLGGDTIDSSIMDQIFWPQVAGQNGIERNELSAADRKRIEDQICFGPCRTLKQEINEKLTAQPERLALGDWSGISVGLPIPSGIRLSGGKEIIGNLDLSAEQLHEVMLPFLTPDLSEDPFEVGESAPCDTFAKLVEITMERAGLSPTDIDILILHGGSCLSPFVPLAFERMKEAGILSADCKVVNTPDRVTSVARGAALYGSLSKKYGKPYIHPIVTEEICIQTLGGEFVYVVHAGQELPYEKTFPNSFYLSFDDQREIVVPIHVGYDAARRRIASTLTIPIPAKLAKSHPVEVELRIGIDKDSSWRFRPKGFGWSPAYEVANPWIGLKPSEEVTRLFATRRKIADAIGTGKVPDPATLIGEALDAAKAGFPEEALALIEDVIALAPANAGAWNAKGLIHSMRSEPNHELAGFQKASELAPDVMIFRGNYGTSLAEAGRHEEAIGVMREALANDPSLSYLHAFLAGAFQASGNAAEMNKELKMHFAHVTRKTVRNPDDIPAREELQTAALRIGEYAVAEKALKRIAAIKRIEGLLAGPDHG